MSSQLSSDAYAAFIDVMKEVRVERGITQAGIAAKLGKPQSFMSKSELKERRIDVIEFLELADAMGVDAVELLRRVRARLSGG